MTPQLSCDQARGAKGTADLEDSFLCLRGAFQLLETALPRDHLRIEHIHGHNGEPFNDFTDHVAKMEARSSFFHTRPSLDMHIWRPLLPHLWLLFGQQVGAPPFHGDHFAVPAPQLPPESDPAPALQSSGHSRPQQVELQLSFCTANVLSMYTRPDGYSGKVGYLTAQFQDLALLFAGIQEARTPAGQCRSDQTLRLCSGVDHGQGGVELWVNLKQPYGYVRGRTTTVDCASCTSSSCGPATAASPSSCSLLGSPPIGGTCSTQRSPRFRTPSLVESNDNFVASVGRRKSTICDD